MKAMLIHGDRGDVRDLTELDPYEETHPVRSFLILSSSYRGTGSRGFVPSRRATPRARRQERGRRTPAPAVTTKLEAPVFVTWRPARSVAERSVHGISCASNRPREERIHAPPSDARRRRRVPWRCLRRGGRGHPRPVRRRDVEAEPREVEDRSVDRSEEHTSELQSLRHLV